MANQISSLGGGPPLAGASPRPVATRSAPPRTPRARIENTMNQEVVVAQVNQHLQQAQTDLRLQVDPDSSRLVFQIVQQGTGEVVLQVPSEEVLGMSRRIREQDGQPGASGGLVDREG